jgi:glycosyltransferase involved in cell wall biosynthesis
LKIILFSFPSHVTRAPTSNISLGITVTAHSSLIFFSGKILSMCQDKEFSSEKAELVILIPSKNRAFQLDAALRTFQLHCRDREKADIRVIYKTTGATHDEQYSQLIRDYPEVKFFREGSLKEDIVNSINSYKYLLPVVDDNIFVRDFYLADIMESLEQEKKAIGFSLRLGKNITYCYMAHKPQKAPDLIHVRKNIFKYNWTHGTYDFGFPLEVSSTMYRLADIGPLISAGNFTDINLLEYTLASQWEKFLKNKNMMLCYEYSATFCNPVNIVQESYPQNRRRSINDYSVEKLFNLYKDGYRLKAGYYTNFLPVSCHQEMELFVENISPESAPPSVAVTENCGPLISVVIPCYNSGAYLHDAVRSIIRQGYKNFEIIVVDDGSIDNTATVANCLIERYKENKILLIRKENEDTPETRNKGISAARGEWILPLDSDDFFKGSFLEKAVEIILKEPEVNLVSTNLQCFGYSREEWLLPQYSPENILRHNTFIYASLYKKELWEKSGGYDPSLPWGNEDWNFWIACTRIGIRPAVLKEKLFLYRQDIRDSRFKILEKYQEEVKAMVYSLNPDFYARNLVLRAQEIIAGMHIDTYNRLSKINKQFKSLPMPYLWLGLYQEKRGNIETALTLFNKAAERAKEYDWQPFFKMAHIYRTFNDNARAQENFNEFQKRKNKEGF